MLAGKRIHVIDDDSGFRRGMQRLLRAHGVSVSAYASAEDWEAEGDPGAAECLIVDVNLGGMSGVELLGRLTSSGVSVPVILVTGSGSEALRRAASAAGCRAWLEKPLSATVLVKAVSEAITGGPAV